MTTSLFESFWQVNLLLHGRDIQMTLSLYYHPLSSFCHKVLIALYELQTPFEKRLIDLSSEQGRHELYALWPIGKFPVIRDERLKATIPETSIIIEYLDKNYPRGKGLLPNDFDLCLQTRHWDRFYDTYVHTPMQRVISDRLRPEADRDPIA